MKLGKQTRIKCPTYLAAYDKYGIGNWRAAALASSLLHDVTKYIPEDEEHIFEKNKVYQGRVRTRLK